MATQVDATNRVLISPHDAEQASGVLAHLEGPHGTLRVERHGSDDGPVPDKIGRILQHVLSVMASGGTVTITSTPAELTTSAAAAVLGISRPTLLKMVTEGTIAAHKVGSHTRFKSDDVFAERRARRDRERAAFAALRELDDDNDET